MRPPAVAIAALFGCGVVLGQASWLAQQASSRVYIGSGLACLAVLIFSGIYLTRVQWLVPAVALSCVSWLGLGVLAASIANRPRPADSILSLVESGRVSLQTPLRWHGHLRDEPARLPWGYGYEIELRGVEYEGTLLPARGGLRVSFANPTDGTAPPNVHAEDEITVTTQARRPQVFRDDGAFDRRAYLEQQNIDLIATLRAAELMKRTAAAPASAATLLSRARCRLREEIDILFEAKPQVGGVLRAMLLGDRSFVERAESTDFQKTGVFHVLVVAGLHVGALAVFLFWIGRLLRLTPFWTAITTLALLMAYVAVVEQRPPVLRAALMTAIVVLGGLFFRRLELMNSAGLAALILLVAKPPAIRDSSFQLTFLAIGCIAGLAAPWLEATVQPYVKALRGWRDLTRDASHEPRAVQLSIDLRSVAGWVALRVPVRLANATGENLVRGIAASLRVWELLVITLALQIGMLPLMARDFHRVTLSAPLVNLVAVPLTGLVVPLGFLTLGGGLVVPSVGKLLAVPLGWMTTGLLRVVEWFAQFPRWSYRIPGPPEWLVAIFLAAGVMLAVAVYRASFRRGWMARSAAGVLGLSALTIATFPFAPRWSAGKLELTALDVGQGDSLFVVSPHGKTLLIDGGGAFGGFGGQSSRGIDPGEEAVSAYLWSRGFKNIDIVALTHAHQDHLGGLAAVLENFHVGQLRIGREVRSQALANVEKLATDRKIPIEHDARADAFAWDEVQGKFLWPEPSSATPSDAARNDDSLVIRLRYAGRALMLPGDAEKEAEREMLSENSPDELQADVLKIGHHGSRNSTTAEFLAAVRPRLAVISVGEDNPYGHPNAELLDRLANAGVRVLRTDRNGAVHILMDSTSVDVRCFVPCPLLEPANLRGQANKPDHQEDEQQ